MLTGVLVSCIKDRQTGNDLEPSGEVVSLWNAYYVPISSIDCSGLAFAYR
jgi:hypothetical protein